MSRMTRVAVLDHGMGNLRSVCKALEAAGLDTVVTSDAEMARRAHALCLPGQGIFGRCIDNMADSGLDELVRSWVADGRPLLGICLGLQVLFDSSEEGNRSGLGLLGGQVRRLSGDVRIPHIGWNNVDPEGPQTSASIAPDSYFYFDHSYAAFPSEPGIVGAWCQHGGRFAAVVSAGPILAFQFHPEKSGREGITLLQEWGRSI